LITFLSSDSRPPSDMNLLFLQTTLILLQRRLCIYQPSMKIATVTRLKDIKTLCLT